MPRVLVVTTTTGYQTRAFDEAARRLGIDLVFVTDRCDQLDDPWRDSAIPIKFHTEDDSVRTIAEAVRTKSINGVLALADKAGPLAARSALVLGLPGHPPEATRAAGNKLASRLAFRNSRLLTPWFEPSDLNDAPERLAMDVSYPCVLKPLSLSGSRGVIKADNPKSFVEAFVRLRQLLQRRTIQALRDPASSQIMIEGFIDGDEFALEGVLEHGELRVLAIFDKPDRLDGPFFEETIYVTPSRLPSKIQKAITREVCLAIDSLGLRHGPIHAECRVNAKGVWILEVAARPIGGLCARALRFVRSEKGHLYEAENFEAVLLRHAAGESIRHYTRETCASAVMMLPIPRRGRLRSVEGMEKAEQITGVDEVRITAKIGQLLEPIPEGASYLGFVFARAESPALAVYALKSAHAQLNFEIERPLDFHQ